MIPTAARTVESVVPTRRIRFTLIPAAFANMGLDPAADIAMPVFDFMNSHTKRHMKNMKRSRPVGTVKLPILNERVSFITPLKDVDREMVFLKPLPALGHFSSPFWNGRSIQSMFMNAMMEKPT